jgi:hypothetical protein
MAKFLDMFDLTTDNFMVMPRNEWRIVGMGKARKNIKVVRFCRDHCEFYKEDHDHYPLCFDDCKFWIIDKHIIMTGEPMVNLLFATNVNDVNEGFSMWIGENYLRKFIGDKHVDSMLEIYADLIKPNEDGYEIN